MNRFGHSGFREDCDLLVEIVRGLGEEAINQLTDILQSSPATEAAEAIGILSQLAPDQVSRLLQFVCRNGRAPHMTARSDSSLLLLQGSALRS